MSAPALSPKDGPLRALTPDELTALTKRASEGDREAFGELVVVTSPACYQLAYRLVGNEHDARDVVQETYLRAYRGLKHFRGDAAVTTWLYRITANCASRHLERRSRSQTSQLSDDLDLADLRPERDPQLAFTAADDRGRLVEALGELPDSLRAVVVLRDVYDLSHKEIARQLNISQSAAKVRLHRARRILRDRIFPPRRAGRAEPAKQERALVGEAEPARAGELLNEAGLRGGAGPASEERAG